MGAAVDGALGADGGLWQFRGEAGRTVVVSAGSDEFDTVVQLSSADGEELGWDDDGGPGTDSRLVATLPEDGEYEVVVATFSGDRGRYTVIVEDAEVATGGGGSLAVGDEVEGVLGVDSGVWGFRGEAGRGVFVEAGSVAFDTVVELRALGGESLGRDDDGGLGTDARLVTVLPADGEYEVVVTAFHGGGGRYTVAVGYAPLGFVDFVGRGWGG